jgi:hypothetical protein
MKPKLWFVVNNCFCIWDQVEIGRDAKNEVASENCSWFLCFLEFIIWSSCGLRRKSLRLTDGQQILLIFIITNKKSISGSAEYWHSTPGASFEVLSKK